MPQGRSQDLHKKQGVGQKTSPPINLADSDGTPPAVLPPGVGFIKEMAPGLSLQASSVDPQCSLMMCNWARPDHGA